MVLAADITFSCVADPQAAKDVSNNVIYLLNYLKYNFVIVLLYYIIKNIIIFRWYLEIVESLRKYLQRKDM